VAGDKSTTDPSVKLKHLNRHVPPTLFVDRPAKLWEITGGLVGSTVMTCTIVSTPVIGFALSAVMRVAGTQVMAMLFDHVGFLGMPQRPITAGKAVGLVVVLCGATHLSIITIYGRITLDSTPRCDALCR